MKLSKISKMIILSFLLCFIFTNTNVLAQAINKLTATIVQFQIFLNGEEQVFDSPVVVIENRTYVPLRELAEKLNLDVAWNENERKIDLKGDLMKDDETMISIFIYPSSVIGVAYRIDLSYDGHLTSTVGKMNRFDIDDNIKNFISPKVTRYEILTEGATKEMSNLVSQITDDEINIKGDDFIVCDGWYVSVIYKGKIRRYGEGGYSEHMLDIIKKLEEHSPIKIVMFNYEDPYQVDYYNNLDW